MVRLDYRAMGWQVIMTGAARKFQDRPLQLALKKAGGVRALARALGISHTAILTWRRVPYERLIEVEKITDIPREILRPELYR
jgi:DNA-binding transcriptional regulator YdaS (Cro superfamily)